MTLDKLRKYCEDHKDKDRVIVVVGYAQEYATEVHERTDIPHKVGEAKYLTNAAKEVEPQIRESLRKSKDDLPERLLKAGLLIQRESQLRVPVDTSALKASAFTTIEPELDRVAAEARMKSDTLRLAVLSERSKK